jgi:serine/threonine protein phosphatase PrpC
MKRIAGVLWGQSPQDACQTLVDLALEHGGMNNVTVLLEVDIPL